MTRSITHMTLEGGVLFFEDGTEVSGVSVEMLLAVPELLEALEAVMSYVHNVRKHIDDGFALGLVFEFEKIVTEAIAKAKGESQ